VPFTSASASYPPWPPLLEDHADERSSALVLHTLLFIIDTDGPQFSFLLDAFLYFYEIPLLEDTNIIWRSEAASLGVSKFQPHQNL